MIIYTDGSFNRKTPHFTAFGGLIIKDETINTYIVDTIYGNITSKECVELWNVGGEIFALVQTLDYVRELYKPPIVDIYYDYLGLEKWANDEWAAKKPATMAYKDYINKYRNETTLIFHKVKSHSTNRLNNAVDKLAKMGLTIKENEIIISKDIIIDKNAKGDLL